MLKLEDVRSGYGQTIVLNGLSLEVAAGETKVLLGRNGVGKTTLLRTIMGSVRAFSGRITLGDADIGRLQPHRRARAGLGYVPQDRDIFPGLSVEDNLRVAAVSCRPDPWQDDLESLLEEFAILGEKRSAPGGSLSGGQQQILALARALITRPKVLLLDEPSEGIQPSIVQQIAEVIARIESERGLALVVVEQNLDFVARFAEEAHVVDKGRVVQRLRLADLIADKSLQHQFLGI
jgi:urea ABC transporter ATP-binding protein UrtE